VVHALYGQDVSTVTTDAFAPLSMPHSTRLYTVLDEDKRVGVLMEIYHSCSVGAPSLPPPPRSPSHAMQSHTLTPMNP
jgi:hypothetical protein